MRRKTRVALIVLIILAVPLTIMSGVLGSVVELPLEVKRLAWPLLLLVTAALVGLAIWQFWLQAGTEPSAVDTCENRRIILKRVTDKWIRDFLEDSVYYDELPLPLPLRVQGSRYDPPGSAHSLQLDTKILEIFDQARGQLLILGKAGAGKTTVLLKLARDLLQRARNNENEAPIPVVLTLSSWATKELPLEQWVIEEIKTKYHVATELGQAWVRDNQLLLLLDGLDEVAPDALPACIRAVNSYMRQAHRSLVVCSRMNEYLGQPERLSLRTEVAVLPLSSKQISDYLDGPATKGEDVEGLKHALHQSESLRTLATTPLLLKVLILAYQGKSAQDLLPLIEVASPEDQQHRLFHKGMRIWSNIGRTASPEDQQHRLFHDYVERMLQRAGPRMQASEEDTKRWLAWLAHQLTEHHQTEFYLEQLQPDWLPTRRRDLYRWSLGLGEGLFVGLLFGLFVGLSEGLVDGLFAGLACWLVVGLIVGQVGEGTTAALVFAEMDARKMGSLLF